MGVSAVSSDRSGRRVLHFVVSGAADRGGLCSSPRWARAIAVIVIGGFCLAAGGVYSGLATFWTVPPLFLGGTAAAGAFALINSVGNLSGYRRDRPLMGLAAEADRRL